MKKLIVLGFLALTFTWSCEDKFTSGVFKESDIEFSDSISLPGSTYMGKKGIALSQGIEGWSAKVSSTKAYWHYSGASKISIREPGNIDFVPMLEDTADLNDEVFSALEMMKEEGSLNYILGFNEPDDPSGLNITVEEALVLWPQLEQFEVPLGSPLCMVADGAWMDNFMAQAAAAGHRVDYVSVQWSGESDVTAFLEKIESIHNKYGLPVWICNFTVENARASEVMAFLEAVLPELESMEYVFRYAWLPGDLNTSTAFWDNLELLTNRGQYYADLNPNDYISQGRDDWIDYSSLVNIATNPGFETGDMSEWSGYGIALETEDVNSGSFAGRAATTGWKSGSAIGKYVPVEGGLPYYISFAMKLDRVVDGYDGHGVRIQSPDKSVVYTDIGPILATEWTIYSTQITLPPEADTIWISAWRPKNSPETIIDDLFVAKIE